MPLSSKRFIVSTSALNQDGFRMMTSGGDLEAFKKNPIMLWMHQRATEGGKHQLLPIGHWTDIQVNGDEISAIPFFDEDEFSMTIHDKVESGTLRTCSVGAIPLEVSDAPEHLLDGQTRLAVTKWRMMEVSITDFPSNPDAITVALYDNGGNMIRLSSNANNSFIPLLEKKPPVTNMLKLTINAADLAVKLGLKADVTETDFITAINGALDENIRLKADYKSLQDSVHNEKVAALVDNAIADRKIVAGKKAEWIALAQGNFEATKKLLDGMAANPTVKSTLGTNGGGQDKYIALSWKEMDKKNLLEKCQAEAPEIFDQKYFEQFGRAYKR